MQVTQLHPNLHPPQPQVISISLGILLSGLLRWDLWPLFSGGTGAALPQGNLGEKN